MMKWVDVKNELPNQMQQVLVANKKDSFVGWLDVNDFWTFSGHGNYICEVTHWMPFPQPPCKEEK